MKAVILARVSTTRQEEEGLSLDNQLNTLRNYAKQHGFHVVQEFRFSESADSKIRRKFLEMIEVVKNDPEIKVVIAYRVDRITRNFRDAVLMDELRNNHDKELHFVFDRLVIGPKTVGRDITDWDTKVYLAKQVINRLKEDAHVSARFKLRNGECPWKAPFGYTNFKNEDGKRWVAPDPFKSKVVIKLYEWYATGAYSMLQLRDKVKEAFGLKMPKGHIDFILKNPFYYGEMAHDGTLYPHKYQTIISKQLFDQVQSVKAGFCKQPTKYAGLPYLYRGLIRCGQCGCVFTPEKKRKKSGREYVYYHCTGFHGKCKTKWLSEENLTEQLSQLFERIHIPDEIARELAQTLKESHEDKKAFHQSLFTELSQEYERFEKRIERMYEDYLDGRITESMYNKKREEYRERQGKIQLRLGTLQSADEEYYRSVAQIVSVASRAGELFKSSEVAIKRELITLVLQNPVVNDATLCATYKSPFNLFVEGACRQDWLPFVDAFRTWLTLPPWEREPALWGLYHPQESGRNLAGVS